MNIDTKLEQLKQIKQVDAPPFLLTRIKQQIRNKGLQSAPVQWRWAFGIAGVLTLALNISILFSQLKTVDNTGVQQNTAQNVGIEKVVSSMNLSSSNNLYNE